MSSEWMSFGRALEELKEGKRVSRVGWNGNGQWLGLQKPDGNSMMKKPYLYISPVDGMLCPWLASQSDMLSDDWVLVD